MWQRCGTSWRGCSDALAYYYVTWAKAFPDYLDALGLPYKAAYASALSMVEQLK